MEKLTGKDQQTTKKESFLSKMGMEGFISKYLNRKILFLIKIVVTLTILWFIFRKIDLQEVFAAAIDIRLSIFGLLILISVVKFFIQCKNWERFLKITTDYQPAKHEILKSHFIGLALRFLIPGGHATFGKVYFVTNKKKATLFSISIERFMQTWTNLWFASWAGFIYFRQLTLSLRITVLIIITLIPVIVYWSSRIFKKNSWKKYFDQYIRLVPTITGRQLFFVFLTILQYLIIINQFQSISLAGLMITVPLILIANIIPITYAGLGLRETFAIHLLRDYNIQPKIAVTASLVIFILNAVLPALIGAILLLTTDRKSIIEQKSLDSQ